MSNLGSTPSLATATSTRLDSACKHIQQCRVSQDHMTMLVGKDADELIRNKYRYCVHKDELVVGITRPLGNSSNTKRFQNSAYPRVISNLGKMLDADGQGAGEAERVLKLLYHHSRSLSDRKTLLEIFNKGDPIDFPNPDAGTEGYLRKTPSGSKMKCVEVMQNLYDLVPVGYANTMGWAHAHCGDTMSSVMIGGLRTVRNGHFEVYTGDVLQWYWPFEKDCFDQNGARKESAKLPPTMALPAHGLPYNLQVDPGEGSTFMVDAGTKTRMDFRDRQYGQPKGTEKHVPMIKPFIADGPEQSVYDWCRVFARAIAPARPGEELDIMIHRQAV